MGARFLAACAALVAILAGATPLEAQWRAASLPSFAPQASDAPRVKPYTLAPAPFDRSTLAMTVGGVAAGAVGYVAGALIGYHLNNESGALVDLDAYEAGMIGGIVGEVLLLPVGVHLANGGEGSLLRVHLASTRSAALVTLAALAVSEAFDDSEAGGIVWLTMPVFQLVSAIRTERATARGR